jgi:hypothetical protein
MSIKKEDLVALILKEAENIKANAIVPIALEFGRKHNIKDKFNLFDAKQELVADTGYFPGVGKKYSLHIINKEKDPVDKMENKGIEVRRSDYPEFTKERLSMLLDMLVREYYIDFKKIAKFITDSREILITGILEGSKKAARPVHFNKNDDEYKTQTMHIRSMKLWNKLEYPYFEQGTKGYMFNIEGINYMKSPDRIKKLIDEGIKIGNAIAMPYEEEFLPSYYIIDIDKMIEFSWDIRISNFLKPLSEDVGLVPRSDRIFKF